MVTYVFFPTTFRLWVLVFNSLMLLVLIHSSSLPTYPPCQSRSAATAPLQRRYSDHCARLRAWCPMHDPVYVQERTFYVNLDTF